MYDSLSNTTMPYKDSDIQLTVLLKSSRRDVSIQPTAISLTENKQRILPKWPYSSSCSASGRYTDLAVAVDGRKMRSGRPGYCCETRDFLQLYCTDIFLSMAEMQLSGINQGDRAKVSKGNLLLP